MKDYKRLFYSALSCLMFSAKKRTEFFRKKHVFGHLGDNCNIQDRKLPLYPNLIHLHNNVRLASNVLFITHDIIHKMLNNRSLDDSGYLERVDCIEVMDNVFIGSGTHILYGVRIGTNVIIGTGSLVNKDIPDNSVYAGVPARYICSFDEYVKKARAYSEQFNTKYGTAKFSGGVMDDKLAALLYVEFCKKRETNV
jgi:acetyltransferase-like isoleucine patch superfamily enzyme